STWIRACRNWTPWNVSLPANGRRELAGNKAPASLLSPAGSRQPFATFSRSDGLTAAFAGTDADTVFERQHEDLAVADLPGVRRARGMDDGLDRRLYEHVVDGDLQLQL